MTHREGPDQSREPYRSIRERHVREERLLDAVFLVFTVFDAQSTGSFGDPFWLANLQGDVVLHLVNARDEAEIVRTPREQTCLEVAGLLAVTLHYDSLTGNETLGPLIGSSGLGEDLEAPVVMRIAAAYVDRTMGESNRELALLERQWAYGLEHLADLRTIGVDLPLLEAALKLAVGTLQEQLLEEGYDALHPHTLYRLKE